MFKYVIAVALLSYIALGDKISDRKSFVGHYNGVNVYDLGTGEPYWDADKLAQCEDSCKQYCPNCTEPVRCGPGERKCGEQPIDPEAHQCSTDDICVPAECECKLDYN